MVHSCPRSPSMATTEIAAAHVGHLGGQNPRTRRPRKRPCIFGEQHADARRLLGAVLHERGVARRIVISADTRLPSCPKARSARWSWLHVQIVESKLSLSMMPRPSTRARGSHRVLARRGGS